MHILYIGGSMLLRALRHQGHYVFTVGIEDTFDVVIHHPFTTAQLLQRIADAGFHADVLFYCDNGNMPLLLDPQYMPLPSIWYSIDTYCNPWHIPYGHAFDLVLVAQKDFVSLFADEGMQSHWFPLFSQTPYTVSAAEKLTRDIPVSFVGTLGHKNNPERKPFLKAFRKLHPLFVHSGAFMPVFTRSHIVLNQSAFSEVNFRCFEAISCGAALLTEHCNNGLEDLFIPGEEILPPYTRGDAAGAAAIAAQALASPQRLKEIARAGLAALHARHTDTIRAAMLVSLFSHLLASRAHEARLSCELERRDALVRGAFGILASDLDSPQLTAHRNFYARLATQR